MRNLDAWRREIDDADQELIRLIARRQNCSKAIARIKSRQAMPIFCASREDQVIKTRRRWASKFGLEPGFVEAIFKRIMCYSKKIQRKIVLKRRKEK